MPESRPVSPVSTLSELFFAHIEQFDYPDLLVAGEKPEKRRSLSSTAFRDAVFRLQSFLTSNGIQPGDRVAILSENRPEWHVADFAILLSRAITVPFYTSLPPAQIIGLLRNSGAKAIIVSSYERWKPLVSLLAQVPELTLPILLDSSPDTSIVDLPGILARTPLPAADAVRAGALLAAPDDVATLIYTSGTTGDAKGVVLTHRNLLFDMEGCLERIRHVRPWPGRALSILPLSHILERLLCFAYFHVGIPIAYGEPLHLADLLKLHRPGVLGCVPRVLERVRDAVTVQLEKVHPVKRRIASACIASAVAADQATLRGEPVPAKHRLRRALANVVVYPRMRRQLGDLHHVICGGAWLNPEVEHFFRAAGFSILQGYGLTETSPVICLTVPGKERPGTVGPPLSGVSLRIAEDGEILVRGENVTSGYWNNPDATAAAFRDGWFHTGDLGRIDEAGNLIITGRSKEILILSTGKNVPCQPTENAILRSALFANCFVLGDGEKFVSALLVPSWPALRRLADTAQQADELLLQPTIVDKVYAELEALQQDLAPHERVKRFCWLHEGVLQDPVLVTPSQKVKRHALATRYAHAVVHMAANRHPLYLLPPSE